MAFTSGFFNSINSDRRYDAIQMSSIFDGIILDGVFQHVGTAMMVNSSDGMTVTVGLGRAWFNHTWSLNDALYPLTVDQSEVVQDRIDTVVLEINSTPAVRANTFKIVKGTPSANPQPPSLVKTTLVNQYPLANIRVGRGATVITQSVITNRVGTSDCPFVTGPLQLMNIDALVAKWENQWTVFYNEQQNRMVNSTNAFILEWQRFHDEKTALIEAQATMTIQSWQDYYTNQTGYMTRQTEEALAAWNDFFAKQQADIKDMNEFWRNQWKTWYDTETLNATTEMANWRDDRQAAFDEWFASLQVILEPDVATRLSAAILDLQNRMAIVETFKDILTNEFAVYNSIDDSDDDPILDSIGRAIDGRVIFCVKPCSGDTPTPPIRYYEVLDSDDAEILDSQSDQVMSRIF